jgi:deaminated glutathione amidase
MMSMSAANFKAACVQLRTGRDVKTNIEQATALIRKAAADGAHYVQTPEQTALMEMNGQALFARIADEADDQALAAFRALASELGIWLHVGSLAIRVAPDKAANRAFVIAPSGAIAARYDKAHMFDVDLASGESYRESRHNQAGSKAVTVDLPWIRLGLSICYDVRFAYLYRALAQAGAGMLAIPAAFTRQTGEAHWHVLQRARAIETGSYVVSAAQGGTHDSGRQTYGHSLIVNPWGEVIAEADQEPSVISAIVDLNEVSAARRRIPALDHDRVLTLHSSAEAQAAE